MKNKTASFAEYVSMGFHVVNTKILYDNTFAHNKDCHLCKRGTYFVG